MTIDRFHIVAITGFTEPFSSLSHLLAAGAAAVGLYHLYQRGSGNNTRFFSLCVFSLSMIFLFSMSGVYHLLSYGTTARSVFQRLDHAAIWVLIAGTFTPIHTLLFRGLWRWGFLAGIWTVAITGLVLEVVFFQSISEWLSLSFYLGLGWMGILSGWKYSRDTTVSGARKLIYGGITYSTGAILEYLRWPILWPGIIGPHELFHVFVVGGAFFHWSFIFERAGHPVITRLAVDVIIRPGSKVYAKTRGEKIVVTGETLEEVKHKLHHEIEAHFPPHVRPRHAVMRLETQNIIHLDKEPHNEHESSLWWFVGKT